MGAIRVQNLKGKFEEIIDNDHKILMLYIHEFILNQDPNIEDFVFDNINKYISYKHVNTGNRSIAGLEHNKSKNKVELSIYCTDDLEEMNKSLSGLGIKWNTRVKGNGALRFRPYLTSIEEFKKIEHLVKEGIQRFYSEKGISK